MKKEKIKNLFFLITISILLVIFSIFLTNRMIEREEIREENNRNLESRFKKFKAVIEYDKVKNQYYISYPNDSEVTILNHRVNIYNKGKFIEEYEFDESVVKHEKSNLFPIDLKGEIDDYDLISKKITYVYLGDLYILENNDGKLKTNYLGKIPNIDGKYKLIMPKFSISENSFFSYIYNFSNEKILEYEYIYRDKNTKETYEVKFRNLGPKERSEKEKSPITSSKMLDTMVPISSKIILIDEESNIKTLTYDINANIIYDSEIFNKLIEGSDG